MTHLLAVYGSLKQGFHNHPLLNGSKFVDNGVTEGGSFYMTKTGSYPLLYDLKDKEGEKVRVELYEIDDKTLAQCDRLEGHPTFYCRKETPVIMDSTGQPVVALMYITQGNPPTLMERDFQPSTTSDWGKN